MANRLTNCHDCGAKPGECHKDGCDIEVCSVCGGQRLQCLGEEECSNHDKSFAKWTGIWPGKAESQYLGISLNDMWQYRDIFFVKCTKKELSCECDCHDFVGGSGKPCPNCIKERCEFCVEGEQDE